MNTSWKAPCLKAPARAFQFVTLDGSFNILQNCSSVVAGVIYYALQLRHQIKQRQTDLVIRLYSAMNGKEFLEAWERFRDREIKSLSDYKEKYGLMEFNQVMGVFEEVGVLLQRKLVDVDLVNDLFGDSVKEVKKKLKPIEGTINETRPAFEYLYNEVKKRDQRQ
jgi:hypothetical protein